MNQVYSKIRGRCEHDAVSGRVNMYIYHTNHHLIYQLGANHHLIYQLGVVMVVIMVVGFTTTCAIRAYQPLTLWVNILLITRWTRCNIMLYSLAVLLTRLCFSPGTHVSSTNKTDRHDIAEILLTVALNTITPNPLSILYVIESWWIL
jgi:hypothetical protein